MTFHERFTASRQLSVEEQNQEQRIDEYVKNSRKLVDDVLQGSFTKDFVEKLSYQQLGRLWIAAESELGLRIQLYSLPRSQVEKVVNLLGIRGLGFAKVCAFYSAVQWLKNDNSEKAEAIATEWDLKMEDVETKLAEDKAQQRTPEARREQFFDVLGILGSGHSEWAARLATEYRLDLGSIIAAKQFQAGADLEDFIKRATDPKHLDSEV